MKTNLDTQVVERDGLASDGVFRIAFNAKMAQILSNGMYSDKISAVIRELSSNAVDSHIESGQATLPIEIHLPNQFEPFFHVRDFGVGLNHEQVIEVYTVYGESTKTQSNDFTGCLGLGSKSPFSYVDAFDVTTIKDGIENQYSMYRSEDGMPSCALLGSRPTNEPNGVTIKMPVKQEDIRRFAERASHIFQWFDVNPKIIGVSDFRVNTFDVQFYGNEWKICKQADRYSYKKVSPVAIMGQVAYPLSSGSFTKITPGQKAALDMPIILYMAIGDMEVAASREAIGYDVRTQKNILARIDNMITELGTKFEKMMTDSKTEWQARQLFGEIFSNESGFQHELSNLFGKQGLDWRGQKIDNAKMSILTEDLWDKPIDIDICTIDSSYRRPRNIKYHITQYTVSCSKKTKILFNDLGRGGIQRAMYWRDSQKNSYGDQIIMFGPSSKKTVNQIVKMLGSPPYELTSNLPKKPVEKNERIDMLEYIGGEGKKAWVPTKVEIEDGGIYVLLNHYNPTRNKTEIVNFSAMIQAAKTSGILKKNDTIYAPRGSFRGKFDKDSGWVEVTDKILAEVSILMTPTILQEIANAKEYSKAANYSNRQSGLWSYPNKLTKLDKTGPWHRIVDAINLLSKSVAINPKNQAIIDISKMFGTEITEIPAVLNTTEIWKLFDTRYPMIKLSLDRYSSQNITQENIQIYVDYAIMCDEIHAHNMAQAANGILDTIRTTVSP